MLKNISWSEYWKCVAVVLLFYYFVVLFINHRKTIFQIVTGKKKLNLIFSSDSNFLFQKRKSNSLQREADDAESPSTITNLIDQITSLLHKAAGKSLVKPEILFALTKMIKANNMSINTAHKHVINDYIKTGCINYCSIHLDDEDVESLWQM